jgi:hypothetical protein
MTAEADTTLCYEDEETIILKSAKENDGWHTEPVARLLDYADTAETPRLREQVRTINDQLSAIRVSFHRNASSLDLGQRQLRRVFTQGSFEAGGRLWGAHAQPFWYGLKGGKGGGVNERLAYLRINGEPVAEVDISACSLSILYALESVPVPSRLDPYLLDQHANEQAQNSSDRRGVMKALFQAMLFRRKREIAWADEAEAAKHGMPHSPRVSIEAFEAAHNPIAHWLHRGHGHMVQRLESDVLVDALCSDGHHLHALPLHDCLIVPESRAEAASAALQAAFRRRLGATPRVTITRASQRVWLPLLAA